MVLWNYTTDTWQHLAAYFDRFLALVSHVCVTFKRTSERGRFLMISGFSELLVHFHPFLGGKNESCVHAAELFCLLLRQSSLQSRWLHALTCTYKQVDSANWNDHGYRIA